MKRKFGLATREAALLLIELEKRREKFIVNCSHPDWSTQQLLQLIQYGTMELYEMAAKAKRAIASKPSNNKEFEWKGFIDVKLTEEQKATYATWDIADSDVWDGIATYCEAGVKIALTYNKQNSSFNCAGTGQAAAGANNGYCVVAHAKDPYNAARVWLFKVSCILPDVWTEYDIGDADDIG